MLSVVVTDILTTYAEVIIGVGSCHFDSDVEFH